MFICGLLKQLHIFIHLLGESKNQDIAIIFRRDQIDPYLKDTIWEIHTIWVIMKASILFTASFYFADFMFQVLLFDSWLKLFPLFGNTISSFDTLPISNELVDKFIIFEHILAVIFPNLQFLELLGHILQHTNFSLPFAIRLLLSSFDR